MYKPLTRTNALYAAIVDGVYLNPPNGATEDQLEASSLAAKVVYLEWKNGHITTEELAQETLRLIAEDVDAGYVPWDVWDFSELHNYVDANCYTLDVLGLYWPDDDGDSACDITNAVQGRVSEMLCGSKTPGHHAFNEDNHVLMDDRKYEYHEDRQRSLCGYLMLMGKDVNANLLRTMRRARIPVPREVVRRRA